MAQIIDENSEIRPPEHSAPLHSAADSTDVSAAEVSAGLPYFQAQRRPARPSAGSHRARLHLCRGRQLGEYAKGPRQPYQGRRALTLSIALPTARTYSAPMNRLSIRYKLDDDGSGELLATLSAGDFSGKSSAWIGEDDVREFISALGAFPIEPANEPLLQGGYWGDGHLDQVHVQLKIEPTGPRGFLRVSVDLATPGSPSQVLPCSTRSAPSFSSPMVIWSVSKRPFAHI